MGYVKKPKKFFAYPIFYHLIDFSNILCGKFNDCYKIDYYELHNSGPKINKSILFLQKIITKFLLALVSPIFVNTGIGMHKNVALILMDYLTI